MLAKHAPQLGPTLTAVATGTALLLQRSECDGTPARGVAHVAVGDPFAYTDDHGNAVRCSNVGKHRPLGGTTWIMRADEFRFQLKVKPRHQEA